MVCKMMVINITGRLSFFNCLMLISKIAPILHAYDLPYKPQVEYHLIKKTLYLKYSFVVEQVTRRGYISSLFTALHCTRCPVRGSSSHLDSGTYTSSAVLSSYKGEHRSLMNALCGSVGISII
jgi:hypothetical protein